MCRLALIPDDAPVAVIEEFLKDWELTNRDGSGLAWVGQDGKINIVKSEKGSVAFNGQLEQLEKEGWRGYLLLHTRAASTGDKDYNSTHPIPCGEGYFAFNGHSTKALDLRPVLEAYGEAFATKTDTEVLAKLFAKMGPQGLVSFLSSGTFLFIDKETAVAANAGVWGLQMVKYNGSHIFASDFPDAVKKTIRTKKIYDCDNDHKKGFICTANHDDKKLCLIAGGFKREVIYREKKWWHLWGGGKTKERHYSYDPDYGSYRFTKAKQTNFGGMAEDKKICEQCSATIQNEDCLCSWCSMELCERCILICNACNEPLCKECFEVHKEAGCQGAKQGGFDYSCL